MSVFAPIREKFTNQAISNRFLDLIRPEMELVESEYERQVRTNIQVINYLAEYVRNSGGKRVRPALLILAYYAAGGRERSDGLIRLATVMEMLHTATLVHDDIIDGADTRRSRPSVNARFGNQTAVLMGDWLYMSAFETSLQERSLEILDVLTRLTRMMTEGELMQLTVLGKLDISRDEYFDILKRKTAFLFSACCEIGGILAGSDSEKLGTLREYGLSLGIAFQLADDLLDFTSDPTVLGKSTGADLLEGKLTLPLILFRKQDAGIDGMLEKIILSGEYDLEQQVDLKKRLNECGAIDEVRQEAFQFTREAIKNLDVLPKTEYRSALEGIAGYVVARHR